MDNTRQVAITGAPNPEFSPEFQYQIVTHMARDPSFFRNNYGWLKADHFSLIECQLVLQTLYEFYAKYHQVPALETMEMYMIDTIMPSGVVTWTQEDHPRLANLLAHIHGTATLSSTYYQEKLETFVQEVQIYNLMAEAQTQGFGNQSEMVIAGMEQIKREAANRNTGGGFSVSAGNPQLIMTREDRIRIPTGLRKLDVNLSGGLSPGELGMITACTGVGKTNAGINFGLSGIVAGWRALIITDEVPGPKMGRRYQAMVTGITADYFKWPVVDWPADVMQQYQFFMHPEFRWKGMEYIWDYSKRRPTIPEIEQAIISWKEHVRITYGEEEAAKCRLVIVDWLDRIATTGLGFSREAKSHEILTELPYQLGEVTRRQDVAMWTEVLNITHTSGAFHKNDALDVSLGLGRINDDETYNDEQEYGDVINEDDDECPPVDRDLVISLKKGRESSQAGVLSFKLYQGESLRFWNSKNQRDQVKDLSPEDRLLRAMGIDDRKRYVTI